MPTKVKGSRVALPDREVTRIMRRTSQFMRVHRTKKDLSWYRLAQESGIHSTTLATIEIDSRDIRISSFIKLCKGLGTNPGDTLNWIISAQPIK